jgi:hypothetical protein
MAFQARSTQMPTEQYRATTAERFGSVGGFALIGNCCPESQQMNNNDKSLLIH